MHTSAIQAGECQSRILSTLFLQHLLRLSPGSEKFTNQASPHLHYKQLAVHCSVDE